AESVQNFDVVWVFFLGRLKIVERAPVIAVADRGNRAVIERIARRRGRGFFNRADRHFWSKERRTGGQTGRKSDPSEKKHQSALSHDPSPSMMAGQRRNDSPDDIDNRRQ